MALELWVPMGGLGAVRPRDLSERARRFEADGWHGMTIYDSQNLSPETLVTMTAAALSTETLGLTVAISNPVTRHPAVTASAILTLAEIAGPRIRYGIGRGDSSQAYIGGAPASFQLFERYVSVVSRYLRGESVPFEDLDYWRLTKPISSMPMAHAPDGSAIVWRAADTQTPPIEVAATGPRALAVAGRWANRVVLGLGADPTRVAWGISQARAARVASEGDLHTLSASMPVSVGVFEDLAVARRAVANVVATAARFAVISGSVVGPTSEHDLAVYHTLGRTYDMNKHAGDGHQLSALTDEFIDKFAIVGPPQHCIERLQELHELGIDAVQVIPPMHGDVDPELSRSGYRRLVEEVLPEVRRHTGT